MNYNQNQNHNTPKETTYRNPYINYTSSPLHHQPFHTSQQHQVPHQIPHQIPLPHPQPQPSFDTHSTPYNTTDQLNLSGEFPSDDSQLNNSSPIPPPLPSRATKPIISPELPRHSSAPYNSYVPQYHPRYNQPSYVPPYHQHHLPNTTFTPHSPSFNSHSPSINSYSPHVYASHTHAYNPSQHPPYYEPSPAYAPAPQQTEDSAQQDLGYMVHELVQQQRQQQQRPIGHTSDNKNILKRVKSDPTLHQSARNSQPINATTSFSSTTNTTAGCRLRRWSISTPEGGNETLNETFTYDGDAPVGQNLLYIPCVYYQRILNGTLQGPRFGPTSLAIIRDDDTSLSITQQNGKQRKVLLRNAALLIGALLRFSLTASTPTFSPSRGTLLIQSVKPSIVSERDLWHISIPSSESSDSDSTPCKMFSSLEILLEELTTFDKLSTRTNEKKSTKGLSKIAANLEKAGQRAGQSLMTASQTAIGEFDLSRERSDLPEPEESKISAPQATSEVVQAKIEEKLQKEIDEKEQEKTNKKSKKGKKKENEKEKEKEEEKTVKTKEKSSRSIFSKKKSKQKPTQPEQENIQNPTDSSAKDTSTKEKGKDDSEKKNQPPQKQLSSSNISKKKKKKGTEIVEIKKDGQSSNEEEILFKKQSKKDKQKNKKEKKPESKTESKTKNKSAIASDAVKNHVQKKAEKSLMKRIAADQGRKGLKELSSDIEMFENGVSKKAEYLFELYMNSSYSKYGPDKEKTRAAFELGKSALNAVGFVGSGAKHAVISVTNGLRSSGGNNRDRSGITSTAVDTLANVGTFAWNIGVGASYRFFKRKTPIGRVILLLNYLDFIPLPTDKNQKLDKKDSIFIGAPWKMGWVAHKQTLTDKYQCLWLIVRSRSIAWYSSPTAPCDQPVGYIALKDVKEAKKIFPKGSTQTENVLSHNFQLITSSSFEVFALDPKYFTIPQHQTEPLNWPELLNKDVDDWIHLISSLCTFQ